MEWIPTIRFPHRIFVMSQYDTISRWCDMTFGSDKWRFIHDVDSIIYLFTNEMDLSLFTLRFPGLFDDSILI